MTREVNHGERWGGPSASVVHFIFLNAYPLSEIMVRGRSYNRHWQIVYDRLVTATASHFRHTGRDGFPTLSPIIISTPEVPVRNVQGRRIPITICASSEPWAKAVICVPQTRHRCLVIRDETPRTVHDVLTSQRITQSVCLSFPPHLTRFQNVYKAHWGETHKGN